MKNNNRGFTLIELIVAIAIMGVLLIIALPQVSKIQQSNKDKKYEAYQESIERAAKLYLDSNEKDLFGYQLTGCEEIAFGSLQSSNLIRDFSEKDISCNTTETFVAVTKVGNEYAYATDMVCKKVKEDGSLDEIVYEQRNNASGCQNKTDDSPPTITVKEVKPQSK